MKPINPSNNHIVSNDIADFVNDCNSFIKGSFADMIKVLKATPIIDTFVPDTYGCDRLFLSYLVNDDMAEDFSLIARDFLVHEYKNVQKYENIRFIDYAAGNMMPALMFESFVLNHMMNAYNSGSEYTKALFIYLYKTYYKSEYKILKRFNSISIDDVITLANEEKSNYLASVDMARILFVSRLLGINIEKNCYVVYDFLNKQYDVFESVYEKKTYNISPEEIESAGNEIKEKYDVERLFTLDRKYGKFIGNALKNRGYNSEYADRYNYMSRSTVYRYEKTLALLKKSYPGREFSEEELVCYSEIMRMINALTYNSDEFVDVLSDLDCFEPDDGTIFNPAKIIYAENEEKKAASDNHSKDAIIQEKYLSDNIDERSIIEELNMLRRKVRQLESDNKNLHSDLLSKKIKEKENEKIEEQLESATRELAALRSHLYNMTEDEMPIAEITYKSMKNEIRKYKIIIIGGHTKWVSKMKKEFSDWTYIDSSVSGTTDASIVSNADKVYFFTDTISHSTYNKYINFVLKSKVAFGYIHGVNIENNVKQIYREMKETI